MNIILDDIEDLVEESQIIQERGGINHGPSSPGGHTSWDDVVSWFKKASTNETIKKTQDTIANAKDRQHAYKINARADRMEQGVFDRFGAPNKAENFYGDPNSSAAREFKINARADRMEARNVSSEDQNLVDTAKEAAQKAASSAGDKIDSSANWFFTKFKDVPGVDSIKVFSQNNPNVFKALVVSIPLIILGGVAFIGYRKIKNLNSPQKAKQAMEKAKDRVANAKSGREKEKAEKDLGLITAKYLTLSKKK